MTTAVKKDVYDVLARANVKDHYPRLATTTPIPSVAGLQIHKHIEGCPGCPYSVAHKGVVGHMATEKHAGQILTRLKVQQLHGGSAKAYFRVNPCPAENVPPVPALRDGVLRLEWGRHLPADLPNARMISPWLMRTDCLHDRVKEYLTNAMVLLDVTDKLALQHLNSSDPDKKGINNTPFHTHYQGEEPLVGYVVLRKSPSQQESGGMTPQDPRAEQVRTREGGGGPGSGICENLPEVSPVNQRAVGQ
ncbi:hypothetical protein DFH09DRAFT_1097205 [Mycena vulgaris]|nr:hypothetical protein DFH09DRAFT_1097205 [Mycena vulgaris]